MKKESIKKIQHAVEDKIPFHHRKTRAERAVELVSKYGLYLALFLSGYFLATIQQLISLQ